MKNLILFFLFIYLTLNAEVPKQVSNNNLTWFGHFARYKLNKKLFFHLDYGLRRADWLRDWSQILVRPGIGYQLNDKFFLAFGGVFFMHYRTDKFKPEYRLWQQISYQAKAGTLIINQRLRIEQRYISSPADEFTYTNRYRYQLNLQVPIHKKSIEDNTFYFTLADEIMFNSGKSVVCNYFDQNRISTGFGYMFNKSLNIQLLYMNLVLKQNSPNSFYDNNTIVLNLIQQLN
jgi:hypothetical protein